MRTAVLAYDEYGNPAPGNTGRFQYTGQLWLEDAGVYHYKNRTYHPEMMRFMQTDPIGVAGGINLYGYVGGDPINFTDPWGLSPEPPRDWCEGDPNCYVPVRGQRPQEQRCPRGAICIEGGWASYGICGPFGCTTYAFQLQSITASIGGGGGKSSESPHLKRLCAERNARGGPNFNDPNLRFDPTIGYRTIGGEPWVAVSISQ